MKIRRIAIRNFRSIKKIDMPISDMAALVGPNNAGKTNILCALNFLLGDRWPMRQTLEPKDWFNKEQSRTIRIQVGFEPNPDNIETIWFECPGDGDRALTKMRYFGSKTEHFLTTEARDKCALVYLDAGRNFDTQFGQSKWSLFGRIIRQLDDHFRSEVSEDVQRQLEYHLAETQRLLKTPLYQSFETAIQDAFIDQLRQTTHQIKLNFRTFDPLNFYKSLQPILLENTAEKNPAEAGSGMRNLIVLALFRAYAKAFRGQALIAIEEPEIYLHPHAQRSLAGLFDDLVDGGAQLFFSTHSAAFINIARSDRVILVERSADEDGETCTTVKTFSADKFLETRERLYPDLPMTKASVSARLSNICGIVHAEAFFARAILLVEGQTEAEAFPILAAANGVDFDAHNISVVAATGKTNLDILYQLYRGHGIPVFLVFDNDRGGKQEDIRPNRTLTKILGIGETDMPDGVVSDDYAIFEGDFESTLRQDLDNLRPGLYEELKAEAYEAIGSRLGKPLIARFIASEIKRSGLEVPTFQNIVNAVYQLVEPRKFDPEFPDF